MLLTSIACACAGEPLRFGAVALLPSTLPGQAPVDVRLFYPDDCPELDRARLFAEAARRCLPPPLSRAELAELLFRWLYKRRLPLVGWGLPAELGRLAAGWRPGNAGGFSLILNSKPCLPGRRGPKERRRRPLLQNGQIENGDRPRITVRSLDGQRAVIRFGGRGRPDLSDLAPDGAGGRPQDGYRFPGIFVDLATLAAVQSGGKQHPSAAAAAAAFGLEAHAHTRPGELLDACQVEATVAELGVLAVLYVRLLDCHRRTPGGSHVGPNEVYSAASYAEGLSQEVGLRLPLAKSDLPGHTHAQAMAASFGGDCGVADRQTGQPVTYLDIAGHYPVSAHLSGAFELLRATRLELVEEDPAELQAFLASVTVDRLLAEPQLWGRLGRTICLVRPDGDLLPHRIQHGRGFLLKTAPLTGDEPLAYLLADVAGSFLETGRVPEIISAISLRPAKRRRQRLRPFTLSSGHVFDPKTDDLFLSLAEERIRLEHDPDLVPAEQARQGKLLKLIVNALCYGLLCQFDVGQDAGDVDVTEIDGSVRPYRVDTVEEPGRRVQPEVAAGITATGRLLLRLARLKVVEAGCHVGYWDTDSICATGLTAAGIAEIQSAFEQLSPYRLDLPGRPPLLELEPENYDPDTGRPSQLHLYATASKNYDLYRHSPISPGQIELVKTSEHGLGHLRSPGQSDTDDREWITEGRHHLLARDLGLPSPQPDTWHEPAMSVITLNRPHELARLQRHQPAGILLRPFSRLAIAHPLPQYADGPDGRRQTPAAPFHTGFNTRTARWRDLTTGRPLSVRFTDGRLREADLVATQGRILCNTIGAALKRNSRRIEAKALDETGQPCRTNTRGPLQPSPTTATRLIPIGKETRNLERAGITEDPAHTLYSDPDQDAWRTVYLPTLRSLAPALLSSGRPSRRFQAKLIPQIAALARQALHALDPECRPPADPEQACYLYLKHPERHTRRTCACGCGATVQGRAQYATAAHRTRAYRARRAAPDRH